MTNKLFVGVVSLGTAAVLAACGAPNSSVPTADTSNAATTTAQDTLPPDEAFKGDRHIMATGATMTFDQIRAQLPARISDADAARLLKDIDPSQVKEDGIPKFSVQQRFWGFRGGWGRWGGFGGFGRFGLGAYGHPFRYFGHRGFGFPYYRRLNYWYPYSASYYGGYASPFLYGYGSSYYPYSYFGSGCGSCGYGGYGRYGGIW